MSRRRLSDDERVLWSGVTRSIAPLRRAPRGDHAAYEPLSEKCFGEAQSRPPTGKPSPKIAPLPAPVRPAQPAIPPLAPLGRKLKQRITRGSHALDARLDLHGMTQAAAHHALLGFLRAAQGRGCRIVLVITGKGSGDPGGERGVLRRQVPHWLRLPEFRSLIVGFESAGVGHGGEGALYVRLRSPRKR